MASEQGSDPEMNKTLPIREPSPVRPPSVQLEADMPGFEYELAENVSTVSMDNSSASSPGMPRFEDFRHPNVKLFVVAMALLCNVFIFVQAFRNLTRQYSPVLCVYFEMDDCEGSPYPPWDQTVEFFFRFLMELALPVSLLLAFILSQLIISVAPGCSLRFKNPVPPLVPPISITCFFYSITSFLTSVSMLPALAATSRSSIWLEYLANTALGLFWMYSLLNIFAFSQLTTHCFIRAREKHQMNHGLLDA